MERVGTLINKLKEQFEQQADAEKLAYTAQLLLAELQDRRMPATQTGGGVSVVMPSAPSIPAQVVAEPAPVLAPISGNWLFDTAPEIPTLSHQEPVAEPEMAEPVAIRYRNPAETFEFNTLLGRQTENLNDKLKEERTEVAHALQDAPIRDLKKAIGLNDRFLFVNELFRGDESMYERSLKTINAFNIYPEAEYWIQRELKVKLSWPDQSDAAQLFNQLVKRRFASI